MGCVRRGCHRRASGCCPARPLSLSLIHILLGLPGTYLPRVSWPGRRDWRGPWNFWWLAHHVDCLVDAAQRARRAGETPAMTRYAARAHRLLRTIRLRNMLVFTNAYYDDMGWLLLAAQRLRALTPVSYTHLDVYKRQPWDWVG